VAVEYLERALPETKLSEPVVWFDLAQGQLSLGRPAAAEQTLQLILSEHPDQALALESFGVARLLAKDLDSAVANLRRAVELNPRRPETHYTLGLALVDKAPEEALTSFGEAIALRPNDANAWHYRGRALQSLGRLDEAANHYRRALEIEPGNGRSYLAIAEVLDKLGRHDEALRYLRHGATAANSPEPVQEALVQAQKRRGD